MKSIICFLFILTVFSCTQSDSKSDMTMEFVLINTSLEISKSSRLAFQNKLSATLDSLLLRDDIVVHTDQLEYLLTVAKAENLKGKQMLESAKEIDESLPYKKVTLDLLNTFDNAYLTGFPIIIQILKSQKEGRAKLVSQTLIPLFDSLKIKSEVVIKTSTAIRKKFNINLVRMNN